MTNFNNYDDDTKAKYDDGIEFLDDTDDFSFDRDDDDNNYDNNDDDYGVGHDIPHYSEEPESSSPRKDKKGTVLQEILSYIKILAVAVIVAFLFTRFIIVNAQVPSGSMENTILTGDRLIGNRLAYLFEEPERGDIVIFKYPDDESQNFVKRIIGVPGDVIQISDGHVYVNGEQLEEDYLREPMNSDGEELTYVVPADCYFMLGDNRNNSKDSRYWNNTFVSKDKIIAKVSFRYFNVRTKRFTFSFIK